MCYVYFNQVIDSHRQISVFEKPILYIIKIISADIISFAYPIMIIPQLLLQQTWTLKLKWDQRLDEKMQFMI